MTEKENNEITTSCGLFGICIECDSYSFEDSEQYDGQCPFKCESPHDIYLKSGQIVHNMHLNECEYIHKCHDVLFKFFSDSSSDCDVYDEFTVRSSQIIAIGVRRNSRR